MRLRARLQGIRSEHLGRHEASIGLFRLGSAGGKAVDKEASPAADMHYDPVLFTRAEISSL